MTGALADGEGSAVSADPETENTSSTSNVCFDPAEEEAEAGAENATETG